MIPIKPENAQWNDRQWEAIHAQREEILISAGAGSGKTAVLVARILEKIKRDGIHVDEMLVLTFTEAAAAEMKTRIREGFEAALEDNPQDSHLSAQLGKVARAQISTFHAFCSQLLRRYYYLLGIDPAFKVADTIDVSIMQSEVLDDLFNQLSEEEDAGFLYLTQSFNNDRDEEGLKGMILKVYELARSNPEMEVWLSDLPGLYQWDGTDLKSWRYYPTLMELILPSLTVGFQRLKEAEAFALSAQIAEVPHQYPLDVFHQDVAYLQRLQGGEGATYAQSREAYYSTKLASFPRFNKRYFDQGLHDQSKGAREGFKKLVEGIQKQYFGYSNETHQRHFQQNRDTVVHLARLVGLFHERFQAAKEGAQSMDFSDLEWHTLALLLKDGKPTETAAQVHAQYREIMIDEYQDTNSMQETIVQAVAQAGKAAVPMFMVGDVKQSIYRFRLAEPGIFQGKYKAFPSRPETSLKIDLMQNYRSHAQVIDSTNFIFRQLMDVPVGEIDYDEAAMLKLGIGTDPEEAFNASELHLIDQDQAEAEDEDLDAINLEARHIARTILGWIREGREIFDRKGGRRLLKFQDVVILMRSLSQVGVFQDVFRDYGIPLFTEQNTDLFDSVEIINLLSALKVIDNPYQDIPLAGLMRSPLFAFDARELALIKAQSSEKQFYNAVKHYGASGPDGHLRQKAGSFVEKIQRWRYEAKMMPLPHLLTLIYEQTLYYDFVLGLPHGSLRKANLDVFRERAQTYDKTARRGVYGFIRYIEQMQQLNKNFSKAKTVTPSENVVRIMTIHKSKGLEFPVVFVAQIHRNFNKMDETGDYLIHKKYGVAVKYIDPQLRLKQKTIAQNVMASLIHREMLAEEMRLLYVAMTRAKSKLIFTGVYNVPRLFKNLTIETGSQWLLSESLRSKGKNYGDWLIPAILRHSRWQGDLSAYWEAPSGSLNDDSSWAVQVFEEPPALPAAQSQEAGWALDGAELDLEQVFYHSYPYQELTLTNAKQSVSQRKAEETVPLFKGIPQAREAKAYDRPSFMTRKKLTGAEAGTALHHFMQHLPVRGDYTLLQLEDALRRAVAQEIIKEQAAKSIDLSQVLTFVQSSLYQQLLQGADIRKELPFMTLVKTAGEEGEALLQGVIDLLAIFESEVWILDYKTDYIQDFHKQEDLLRQRYAIQMKYYKKAVQDMFPKRQVHCHVYFLKAGKWLSY